MTTTLAERTVLTSGRPIEEREEELARGAEELTGASRASLLDDPRFLPVVAGSTMTLGVTAILLGWLGAASSTLLEEQVPYLISGGLLGVALSTIGALVFFSHWLTVSIREARARETVRQADHAALLAAVRDLTTVLQRQETSDGRTRGDRAERPLRRAPRSP